MRGVDRAVIETLGLPGLVLMENAGRGVADVIFAEVARRPDLAGRPLSACVVCGGGQNGGDGFVVARYLFGKGMRVRVLLAMDPRKIVGDAAVFAQVWRSLSPNGTVDLSGETSEAVWLSRMENPDLLVDAIFGTGLRSPPAGAAAAAIEAMNVSPALTVSVDLPSGLSADSGKILGTAVHADITATIASHKRGLWLDARSPVGRVELVPFGTPVDLLVPESAASRCALIDRAMVAPLLPKRRPTDHKGSSGHLLVIAGSVGKTGAAILAGRAALRGGAGLVTVATTGDAQPAIDAKVVAEMTVSYADGVDADGTSWGALQSLLPRMSATVLGPGIPTGPGMNTLLTRMVCEWPLPMVLDADALNLLGTSIAELASRSSAPRVFTPHPGEMGRLLGISTAEVEQNRLEHARSLALATKSTVVLKGARTILALPTGETFVNPHANPSLGTAGSGDVLSGLLGAFLAQGLSPSDAARAAVFVHGYAAELASANLGIRNLVATDLPDAIGRACEQLRPV
jgi:NAD(P)H-hydrate epimerase